MLNKLSRAAEKMRGKKKQYTPLNEGNHRLMEYIQESRKDMYLSLGDYLLYCSVALKPLSNWS